MRQPQLEITVQKKKDVSSKINFNGGSLTYNGAGQKYEKAALDSSVTAGEGGTWTYTYAVKSGGTGMLDTATGLPLRYNNDKQKKPLFSRGLSVCRLLFNSFSKLKIDENYKEKRRLFY